MSESTGSRSRLVMSEMFVFCSGLLVSLAFGVSCQRSRLSEIRSLNVKQPTSTRLRLDQDRTSTSTRLASGIGHERVELSSTGLDPALSFRTHRRRRRRRLKRNRTHRRRRLRLQLDWTRSSSNGTKLNLKRGSQSWRAHSTGSHARDVSCPAAHLSECSSQ